MEVARTYLPRTISPDMTVRQAAIDMPASRAVFVRHGEPEDRPGQFGHLEPLTHFARRRGLPLDALLAELSAATGAPICEGSAAAQRIHRPFVTVALAITLTLGASWGAWLLWRIGWAGTFDAAPAAQVVAHGEAQLWGFVTLFVLGISLRTVLQPAVRTRWGRRAAVALLVLGVSGVFGSFAWFLWPTELRWLGLVSAGLLLAMASAYLAMQITVLHAKWKLTWARAVLASGVWLVAWAGATVVLRTSMGVAGLTGDAEAGRMLVIELAVYGFAMNSIYGFGQMLLPGLLRIGAPRGRAIELAHWLHNAGTAVVCCATALAWPAIAVVLGCVLLMGGAACFAFGHRAFLGRRRTSYRAEQGIAVLDYYPPLAFFWLLASLVLLTAGYVYEVAYATRLPHAYLGAVRHALTVGFVTTLVAGVGGRLLPVLSRTVLALPRFAVMVLVLLGVGNALRVVTEMATIWFAGAYRLMPWSALLEVAALSLFAVSVGVTMYRRDSLLARGAVTASSSIAVLVGEYPTIEDRLIAEGSEYLKRTRSVPGELTIGSFAVSEGWEPSQAVRQINAWLGELQRAE